MNKIKKGLGRGLSSLIGETKVENKTNKLSLVDIVPNKYQPRKNFDEENLNDLVNSIKDYADRVLVIGHTDSTGKADSNWVISRKRAEAIAKWLAKSNNKLTNTITRGVADTEPFVKDTDNDYNQSLNRRVELILVLKG